MFLIDFNQTSVQAFAHGFLKGLAAPVMLYHREPAPSIPAPVILTLPPADTAASLASDWMRISNDLARVVQRHGEASAEQIAG